MKKSIRGRALTKHHGFTLIELLVATAVLLLIMAILLSVTTQAGNLWRTTTAKIEQFRGARDAFEAMTRRLGQATLNTYWDYHYPGNDTTKPPDSYVRQSDLRFISGNAVALAGAPTAPRQWPTHGVFFQAPLGFSQDSTTYGLENLLNTWGYFIEFNSDSAQRPPIVTQTIAPLRYRYRLCELMQPTNALSIYSYTSGFNGSGALKNPNYTGKDWFSIPMNIADASTTPVRPVHVLAENIIALIILPKLTPLDEGSTYTDASLAPNYWYDSTGYDSTGTTLMTTTGDKNLNPKSQLPPLVQVTMVAIDEGSAIRIAQGQGSTMPTFGLSPGVFNSLFTDATKMAADLNTLEQALTGKHINYRVFSTNVAIKGAKWSRDQTN